MKCKICQRETEVFDRAKILSAYSVTYFRCKNCGFVQTEEPYWLDEAYSSAIADLDIGLVARNLYLSNAIGAILKLCFSDAKEFLD